MQIQLNENYKVESSTLQFTLSKKNIIPELNPITKKPTANAGKEEWKPISYYSKLENLGDEFIDKQLRNSESSDIKELISVVERSKKEILDFYNTYLKELVQENKALKNELKDLKANCEVDEVDLVDSVEE